MNLMQLPDEQKNQDNEVDVVLPLFSFSSTSLGFSFINCEPTVARRGVYWFRNLATVSYGSHTLEQVGSDDQDAIAIGASYTVGSLGVAVSMHQVDNVNNTSSDDREGYQMVLTFAF